MPALYTPVDEHYRMPGKTYRLGDAAAGTQRIEIDEQLDEYLDAKRTASGHWESDDVRDEFESALTSWLAMAVADAEPELAAANASLNSMISRIPEDIVFMRKPARTPASCAKAIYVNVAFPSGWCPQCVVGKSFLSIHAPVPVHDDFDPLGRRDSADDLFEPTDKVRFVWTLTPDAELDRRRCRLGHPTKAFSWQTATRLFLRVERQVIAPIDSQTACFFIRIYRYDLDTLNGSVREAIRSSLISMPEAVRAYKGFSEDFDRIVSLV